MRARARRAAWTSAPVEVELASEFRYRDPLVDGKTLVLAISQSGETADTLAAVKEATGLPVVFDAHNAVWTIFQRMARQERGVKRVAIDIEVEVPLGHRERQARAVDVGLALAS